MNLESLKNLSEIELYKEEFNDFKQKYKEVISSEHLIHKVYETNDLENYLLSIKTSPYLFENCIIAYSGRYQKQFIDFINNRFLNDAWIDDNFDFKDSTDQKELAIQQILKLYDLFKMYFKGLIQFSNKYPAFEFTLLCYSREMLAKPYFNYFQDDIRVELFDKDKEIDLLYFKLIDFLLVNRKVNLNEKENKDLKKTLNYFKNYSSNNVIAIREKIKYKLYNYNGFKCPSHRLFLSSLSEKQIDKLTDYTINRFFVETTEEHLLNRFYSGMNIKDPITIKFKQLGYVAYILSFLKKKKVIKQDFLWKSIAEHKCLKIMRQDGSADFVTPNDLASSFKYKDKRIKNKTKTPNNKLKVLILFLNKKILKNPSLHHNRYNIVN